MAAKGSKTLEDATVIEIGGTSDRTPIADLPLDADGYRSAWWKISPSRSTFAEVRAYATAYQGASRSLRMQMYTSKVDDPTEDDLLLFGWNDYFLTGAYGSTDANTNGCGLAAGATHWVRVSAEDGFVGDIILRAFALSPKIDARPLHVIGPDSGTYANNAYTTDGLGGIPVTSPNGELWAIRGSFGEFFTPNFGPAMHIYRRRGDVLDFVGSWNGPVTGGRGGYVGQEFIRDYAWIDDDTLVFIFDLADNANGNNIELHLIKVKPDGTLKHSYVMAGWGFEMFVNARIEVKGNLVTIPCRTGRPSGTTGTSYPGLAKFSIAGGDISNLNQTPFAAISSSESPAYCQTLLDGSQFYSSGNKCRLYSPSGTPQGPAWSVSSVIPNQNDEWYLWKGAYGAGDRAWFSVTRSRQGGTKTELLWAAVDAATGTFIEEISTGVFGPGEGNALYTDSVQTDPKGRYLHAFAGWRVGFTVATRIFTLDAAMLGQNVRTVIAADDDVSVEGSLGLRGAYGVGPILLNGLQSTNWYCTIPGADEIDIALKEQRRRFY